MVGAPMKPNSSQYFTDGFFLHVAIVIILCILIFTLTGCGPSASRQSMFNYCLNSCKEPDCIKQCGDAVGKAFAGDRCTPKHYD
jgi:hypothetical protein